MLDKDKDFQAQIKISAIHIIRYYTYIKYYIYLLFLALDTEIGTAYV